VGNEKRIDNFKDNQKLKPMKKVPGATKFPRAGKSFQTPVVKTKKKVHTLGKSKTSSVIKLLIVLFLCAAAASTHAQTSVKRQDSTGQSRVQDSIARLNAFVKEFSDTASIARFQEWLFKNVTAEQYQNFSAILQQYYGAYISQRYDAFLKAKKISATSGQVKPKQ
jgi:hypothetical protein